MTSSATTVPQLLHNLAAAMEETHRALLNFDGAAFGMGIAAEQRVCRELARSMPFCGAIPRAPLEVIERLQRRRTGLIRATQRTVRALWGVSTVVRASDGPAISELY